MTLARAPGKVVLSGAYAVLHGAPAIVSAVTRFARVDTEREASLVTDEVKAALAPGERAPWFDADELRDGARKLGLGSSAAVLVASLFALGKVRTPELSDGELRKRVFELALVAHRRAQGGGSGVDVAASTFGGTLVYRLEREGPRIETLELPPDVAIEVWACPESAATSSLIAAVRRLGARSPAEHDQLLEAQALASEQAFAAALIKDGVAFVAALGRQHRALATLGRVAEANIVSPALAGLLPFAEAEASVLLPAGAGGGDLVLFVGKFPSSAALRHKLEAAGHRQLRIELSAPGVSAL